MTENHQKNSGILQYEIYWGHSLQFTSTFLPLLKMNQYYIANPKLEDHWSCIAHLSAEDMLKLAVTEVKEVLKY